ncbi:cytochrome P450 [Aspergillus brunneoviolaceus CBS 621.78]|uniref:Cytochrome P450 n=1 Tax=Aspergillus brunneoviolaceus CBS 621.78 TaxID=1450534 RepID=A0ACD1FW92_9EURO|nr:cytochrome P450 [Aspergillus brunneoviolaceus CBS 621.78]RAH41256.1 cytochrome P450 [Aspergillus brunneoviolaceus CBS 621.78]
MDATYTDKFNNFELPMKAAISGLVATVTTVLAYIVFLSYTPRVDRKSPKFTPNTVPLVGSWSFFTQKWAFWQDCVAKSPTGHFSFWLGKYHVVGMSGPAARKVFLDNPNFDFVRGATLVGHGPDFVPPLHAIFHGNFQNGRSYFQRRLVDLQKSEQLGKRLPGVTRDARGAFEALRHHASGVMNPTDACYHLVVQQACRVVCSDEIADDPAVLARTQSVLSLLMHTSSIHAVALPYLPSLAKLKRRWGRYSLSRIVTPIVQRRLHKKKDSPRHDDVVQYMLDRGDPPEWMVAFFISTLFIASANAGYLSGAMLNILAHHPDWQARIYREIKTVAAAHAPNNRRHAPLVDQLDAIPLDAWESFFPSIDLCFKEAIRMWVAFPMIRLNMAPHAVPIPGTAEVVPAGTFAAYNSTEVHFNPDLYPDPYRYDPERFREGREEFKREAYGFVGWGQGRHPCLGMRWAKIQLNIILAYALALYEWTGCDEKGQPSTHFDRKTDLNAPGPSLPVGLFCKYVPRKEM